MNKKKLTAKVAQQAGLTACIASKAIDAVFNSIRESLEKGESTILQGFGSFSINNRSERMGFNPSTRELMKIPTRKVVKFSASKGIQVK